MHREGAWTPGGDEELARRLRPTDWRRVAFEGVGLAACAGGAACLGIAFSAAVPMGAAVFLVGGLGLLSRRQDDRNLEDRGRVFALREEFGLGPVWIVDLIVRQGEAPTGRDQGLMWIEGGRMMYSGLRTSFALAPDQVAQSVRHDAGMPGLRLRLNMPLQRETPAGVLSLSFWPISDGVRGAENDAAGLRYALNTVLDGRPWTKAPSMDGQWPPVGIGPGAPRPAELRRDALLRIAGWSAVGAWIGVCVGMANLWVGLGAFVVVAVGTNWAAWQGNAPRWKAYRDARKVWGEG